MMCRTSIFAFLAAAMPLAAGGVGITVYESVDEHIGSVTVSAGSQSETVSRNGNLTWGSWYIDTAYTASAANVDTGYTARWEVTKSGQATKEGAINEPITLSSAYSECSLRFYGQPNTYTVTFDANGGTITSSPYGTSNQFSYGEVIDFTQIVLTPPTGYEFDGWWTAASGGYQFGNTVAVTSSSTVYAHWKEKDTYTVNFSANGGTITSSPYGTSKVFEYGEVIDFTQIAVSRPGHTFDGWWTLQSGGSRFGDTVPVTSSSTVYAHWTKDTYTVNFSANGGTITSSPYGTSKVFEYDEVIDFTQIVLTPPDGHTFDGWWTLQSGGSRFGDTVPVTSSSTVYAHWKKATYRVDFEANGGEIAYSPYGTSKVFEYYDEIDFRQITLTPPTGYAFDGWWTLQSGGARFGDTVPVTSSSTVYVHWTPNPYEVAFWPNGADGGETMPNQSFTYDVTQNLNHVEFTYTGRAFKEWSTATNYNYQTQYYPDEAAVANLATGGVVNLYANWTGIVYTVSFDANGGEGEMDPIICTYTVPTNIPACTFTRDGWGFSGWTTNGADEVVYADRARVTNLTATAEVTLLACWTGVTYAVVLDARDPKGEDNGVFTNGMGEAVSILTNRYTVGDAWELPTSVTNINKHFFFVGWTYVDTNGVTVTVAESDVVPPPSVFGGATNLVAAWEWEADSLAVAVDAPELSFATRGTVGPQGKYSEPAYDAPWFVQTNYVHDSTNAVQSGALLENGGGAQKFHISWLTTTVSTNGVLTFWWRCSAPNLTLSPEYGDLQGYSFHFGRIEEGGGFTNLTTELTGDSGWRQVVYTNDAAGSVTFAWQFRFTDPVEEATIGGTGWVDRVTWTPDGGTPVDVTSTHAVPYSWLSENFPGDYASASGDAEEIDRIAEGDSPNGKPMKVWQEYWAGTNPNDPNDLFRANIAISNNMAHITWQPDLSVTGKPQRVYHVLCAPTLSTEWTGLQSNVEERFEVELPVLGDSGISTNRFFKVELDWEESQKN